jgi:hypothetical protein
VACHHGRMSGHGPSNPIYEFVQWWRIARSERRRSLNPELEARLANATTEEEVRDAVREHNESAARHRYMGRAPTPLLHVDEVLAQWRARRQDDAG